MFDPYRTDAFVSGRPGIPYSYQSYQMWDPVAGHTELLSTAALPGRCKPEEGKATVVTGTAATTEITLWQRFLNLFS